MDYRYVEDSQDARINQITLIGTGNSPVYECVLSVKFSNEDATEPVSLAEAKDWCAVDGNDYDARMLMLIKAARIKVENVRKVSFINRTVIAKIKPGTNLPYGPVKSITTVVDQTGSEDGLLGQLDYGYGSFYDGYSYLFLQRQNEHLVVTYEAGPADPTLSAEYKIEILQQVAYMFENRGDERAGSGPVSPMIKGNTTSITRKLRQ